MNAPVICFGQQPCGFFPKRFLFAKIQTARRLQKESGGEIVFFCTTANMIRGKPKSFSGTARQMNRQILTLPARIKFNASFHR
jgi:hypothetical protein